MYSQPRTKRRSVKALPLFLFTSALMALGPAALPRGGAMGAEQPFELITQEEYDQLIVKWEQRDRHYRELRRRGVDTTPKVTEMLKKEVTAIRGKSLKYLVFAVDSKSIYEIRSRGLSHFFPEWAFVVIPVLRAQASEDQPREIMYGILPEFCVCALREADGKVLSMYESEWFDGFGEFARECGVIVKGKRDAGLLWNAYTAICRRPPAFIQVRELKFGVWNISSESWKGTTLDILTDSEGRLRDFIQKTPGKNTKNPEAL